MLLLSALAAAAVAAAPCPRSGATLDINQCLIAEAASADAERMRYFQAARARLKQEALAQPTDAAAVTMPAEIDKVEAAWTAYRDLECGAVLDYWSAGTIRVMMEESCYIDLTRRHTHTLWSEWLTYMDSTPPILPEPSVATDP